ncbi:CoF synthetase [Parasedimentitalea marina]|uniref:CoF synthetase n=1 Tax=Parasedimentitalea marina TaxID=2483033 RepID=A0A3T0N6T8_9RHOB|nr:CoF synthetase [Parasedimentitalea marina]AZV79750.1 CoF synthetase [Parasedimentitalea marina]
MHETLQVASAFAQTLWVTRAAQNRAGFDRWQSKRLAAWLRNDLSKVDYYAGVKPVLSALPIVDKHSLMAEFEAFNLGRITARTGWDAFRTTGDIDGISIGASTGTSGNRSLYAITPAERFRWLGTILAKTIPGFLFRPERVAILLPQASVLYEAANGTGRIVLRFFDLRDGPESWLTTLEAFDPTTIVAPPRVLRFLAEHSDRLSPRRLFAGGETLDPMDRIIIENRYDLTLGQIYMASEGLLGVSCKCGNLHLAEDANYFEFEPLGDGLVSPLITGFQRRFQIMARYRMNDLLRLSSKVCACGSPLRIVDEIVGRMDDAFVFRRPAGLDVLITPDVLRNAVLDVSRDITDFRIQRTGRDAILLTLHPGLAPSLAQQAKQALSQQFSCRGLSPNIDIRQDPMDYETGPKLRRIENRFQEDI